MDNSHNKEEWWDVHTVMREREIFIQLHGDLEGLAEDQLRRQFGMPDVVSPSGYKVTSDDTTMFVADSYHYYSLLPHTAVGFAVYMGTVHGVYFTPKVRSCSPDRQDKLGNMVAPE